MPDRESMKIYKGKHWARVTFITWTSISTMIIFLNLPQMIKTLGVTGFGMKTIFMLFNLVALGLLCTRSVKSWFNQHRFDLFTAEGRIESSES